MSSPLFKGKIVLHSFHQTIQILGITSQFMIITEINGDSDFSPSGQFSKNCFIMYIGKFILIEIANILGITFPLSLHKLVTFH